MTQKVTTTNPTFARLNCATAFALLVGTIGGCGGTKNNLAASEAHSKSKTEVASQSNKSNAEDQGSVNGEGNPADNEPHAEKEMSAEEAPVDEKKLQVQYAEAAKTEITADNAEKFAANLEQQLDAELAE